MPLAPRAEATHLSARMVARALIFVIRLYQWMISPLLGRVCRFEPSCSRYAAACLASHGALRGSLLSAVRVCKCHPLHPGGFDPPPPPRGALKANQPAANQRESRETGWIETL